jgi:hypothetical protein
MTQHPRCSASMLRRDLTTRALNHARANALLHDLSTGASPAVLFGRDDQHQPVRHGNFHPAAYAAICAWPEWLRRLAKVHTASRRSRARKDWRWMELDSAASSDALLMNIFCHPGVFDGTRLAGPVATLLNVDPAAAPCFGTHPGVPLLTPLRTRTKKAAPIERVDRTEIDLTLGNLFIEAKLTESDFQTAAPALIARYRDLEAVFDPGRLPRKTPPTPTPRVPHPSQSHRDGWDVNPTGSPSPDPDLDDSFLNLPLRPTRPRIAGYQLIRNVLAAHAADAAFCVLCDARRHDLIDLWYEVLSAVHSPTFATRLKLLTWQELAATLPRDLQHFLATKYGITS